MAKFSNSLTSKIISFTVLAVFLLNTTVYGIDLPNKCHLRPPLMSNSEAGKKRSSKTAGQLSEAAPPPVIVGESIALESLKNRRNYKKLSGGLGNRRMILFTRDVIYVAIDQYAIAGPDAVNPILGTVGAFNCMILILYDPVSRIGFLSHFPNMEGRPEKRFIDKVLKKLRQRGVRDITKLQAKLLGGSGTKDAEDAEGTVKDRIEKILKDIGIKDIKREDPSNEVSKTAAIDVRAGEVFNVLQDQELAERYNKDRRSPPILAAELIFDLLTEADFTERIPQNRKTDL